MSVRCRCGECSGYKQHTLRTKEITGMETVLWLLHTFIVLLLLCTIGYTATPLTHCTINFCTPTLDVCTRLMRVLIINTLVLLYTCTLTEHGPTRRICGCVDSRTGAVSVYSPTLSLAAKICPRRTSPCTPSVCTSMCKRAVSNNRW